MAERDFALSRQRIDQLVGLAGLDDLAPLNMAALAQLGELAIDLLMVGLPEKADRGIERLGELIARHRPFGQAGEDGVGKGQRSISRSSIFRSRRRVIEINALDFMHIIAYASICI